MRFYQEITLIKTPEISPYFIWGKLYMQLHLALVEQQNSDKIVNIGVSFPEYRYVQKEGGAVASLGEKLRIFSSIESDLEQLKLAAWLERLNDYVHIKSIQPVPENVKGYAIYKRKQVKTNAERLARANAKKGRYDYENALEHYRKFITITDLPYVQMKSLTSVQPFKLFIEKQSAEKSASQIFSTYGLSSESSLPEF